MPRGRYGDSIPAIRELLSSFMASGAKKREGGEKTKVRSKEMPKARSQRKKKLKK